MPHGYSEDDSSGSEHTATSMSVTSEHMELSLNICGVAHDDVRRLRVKVLNDLSPNGLNSKASQ